MTKSTTDIFNYPSRIKIFLKNFKDHQYYFVGGMVRDILLGKKDFFDVDIVVISKNQKNFFFSKNLKPVLVNDRFNTLRFIVKKIQIDLTFSENILEDLKRRDFTINCIALDSNGKLFDPFNFSKDLYKRIIRTTNENSFVDDPLRILRAFRFKYQLDFKFSKNLKNQILTNKNLLKNVPGERIVYEIKRTLSCKEGFKIFKDLNDYRILEIIFPELTTTKKFPHRKFKSKYLMKHLLNTVEAVNRIISSNVPRKWKDYFKKYFFEIYLSALFHDIKKPETYKLLNKKQTFFNHEVLSSIYIRDRVKNDLKLSNDETERIEKLIKNHMRPHYLVHSKTFGKKGMFKILKDLGHELEGLFILSMADKLSSEGVYDSSYIKFYRKLKNFEKEISRKKISFIRGRDILEKFNLKPGPLIGKLIKEGNYYAVENSITDKEKILSFLETKIIKDYRSDHQ